MSAIEVTRNQTPIPLAPVDASVKIPESVLRASAAADAMHATAYETPQPQPEPQPAEITPQPEPQPAEITPQPVAAQPAPRDDTPATDAEHERARYNSMKGRWEQAQQTIGSMQEQMAQLGDELMRTQALVRGGAPQPQQRTDQQPTPQRLLTPEDENNYGTDLIDFAKRAAKEAVAPEIEALRQENQSLKQRVNRSSQEGVNQTLDSVIPNWRQINVMPEWKSWLRKRDIYSGQVRQALLDSAAKAADAPRVVEFFKGFLAEEGAATGAAPAPQPQPTLTQPRIAAVALDALSTPGRARPASGNTSVPADKPVFTRQQVAKFYADVRRGAYAGREPDKARDEAAIFAAQADNRIR